MADDVTIVIDAQTTATVVQAESAPAVITVEIPGLQGVKGDPGIQGVAGPASALTIGSVTKADTASATITGTAPNQTLNLTLPKGDKGDAGPANSLSIGTVTTLPYAGQVSATITGTSPAQVLNLALPRGADGIQGPANTLTVGTVTTLPTGSQASVSITGTSPNQVINFSIPTGPQGNAGAGSPDATTTAKGAIQLAGDLSGTAGAPTVPGLANKVDSTDTRLTNARTPTAHATTHATGGSDPITPANIGAATSTHTHTSSAITDAASAATPNVVIKRDANGRAQVVDPSVAADIATKNYVDTKVPTVSDSSTTTKGVVQLAGDLGGTAAAPTVTGGTHHSHTSAQISDAAAGSVASVAVLRDANGTSAFNQVQVLGTPPTQIYHATRKDYVDTQVATRAATSHTHVVADISATGTKDGTTFLRGDGAWAKPTGGSGVLVLGATDTVPANTPANTVIVRPGTPYGDEQARDALGAALVAGSNITITPNDAADTITIAQTAPSVSVASKGVANGVASLDSNGLVPVAQLSNVFTYISPALTYCKSVSTTRASTTTLAVDPDLNANLNPGIYMIEAELRFLPGATSGNIQWQFSGSAGYPTTQNMTYTLQSATGSASGSSGLVSSAVAVTNAVTTQTTGFIYRVNTFVNTNTGGTVGVYWAQNTSTSTTQTLAFGSWMRVTKVG